MQKEKAPVTLDHLHAIALQAGVIMKNHFTHFGMDREVKSDSTPVTLADKDINQLVIKQVRALSSEIDIIGEEASARTDSPWQIMTDPVDGTFPYTWGMPVATFMLGLMYNRKPVMGIVYDPFTNRMYSAEADKGAWMNGTPLKVSSATLADNPVVGFVSWPGCPYNVLDVCKYLEQRGVTLVNFCSTVTSRRQSPRESSQVRFFPGDIIMTPLPAISLWKWPVAWLRMSTEIRFTTGKTRSMAI